MNPDRFAQIERVCQAALDQPPDNRRAFLDVACGADEELRREVESLLAASSRAASFFEMPAAPGRVPTLIIGQRLGPYEVTGRIGAGGMGEVYAARDSRLDRSVAIKILSADFSADPDRRARFEREAKTIASLNHPHICTLHDVGEQPSERGGPPAVYLVMERLAGETLAARLLRGPLPLNQALLVATDIADALAAAHRAGVIHRDLKPANVMVTKTGVKLLDFGLAKITRRGEMQAPDGLSSISAAALTGKGTIVGTLSYMAPEQVQGKSVDSRADVWAFGAILYEMLTGKRPFESESAAGVVGAILERETPHISSVLPVTPAGVDRLVQRCLAKDPNERWQSADDLAHHLRWLRDQGVMPALTVQPDRRRWRALGVSVALMILTAVASWAVMVRVRPAALPATPLHAVIDVGPLEVAGANTAAQAYLGRARLTALALSPDGRTLVFVGRRARQQQLYRRMLHSDDAVPLAGTEGAEGPFFSPDGQWVAFWADRVAQQAVKALFRVPISGGVPTRVCSVTSGGFVPLGGTWGDDGHIVFAQAQVGLFRVAADGSQQNCEAEHLHVSGDDDSRVSLPHLLPGSRSLLLTESALGLMPDPDQDRIVLQPLSAGRPQVLVRGATDARYVAGGHLVYTRWGRLYAAPFDVQRSKITGPELAVLDNVMQSKNSGAPWTFDTGAAQVTVSSTGTVAYLTGGALPEQHDMLLAWRDMTGTRKDVPVPAAGYGYCQLSPDGQRVLYRQVDRGKSFVWTVETGGGRARRLTSIGSATAPLWSADGTRVLMWFEDDSGAGGLAWIPEDGSRPPEFLTRSADFLLPCQWTSDGKTLILVRIPRARPNDIYLLSFGPEGKLTGRPWRETAVPFGTDVNEPALSPDGRWLAYSSVETRLSEIYVDSFERPGSLTKVSVNGGRSPVWSPNGRTLFYTQQLPSGLQRMMSVEVRTTPTLAAGVARPLFDGRWLTGANRVSVSLARDGQRFLLTAPEGTEPVPVPAPTRIHLIQNWVEELKARMK